MILAFGTSKWSTRSWSLSDEMLFSRSMKRVSYSREWASTRILVKNSWMCRTGVLQDSAVPLRLRQRFMHEPHPAHPTHSMGTRVLTKPLPPSPVLPLANPVRDLYARGVFLPLV
jgi:hypothetical protein